MSPSRRPALAERVRTEPPLIDALHVGILVFDPSGRLLDINRQAASLLEIPREAEPEAVRSGELPPGSVVTLVAEKTLRDRRPVPETIGPLLGDGSNRLARCTSSAVRDAAGKILAFVLEFQDVTAVVRMEQEVRQLDRLATVGRFASAIAHEIRNPLTGIYAGVQFLEKTLPEGNEQQKMTFRIVREEVERLNRIVEDMLGSARPPVPRFENADPNALARKACRLLEEEGRRRSVRIVFRCDETLPPIRLDPDLIEQVLLNLGRNAIEASPDGGEVLLETSASQGSPLRGAIPCVGGPGVEFRVSDQGPGVAPGERERIFEPFRTSKKRGTGLGLYISFQIMERHGGALWLRTEGGKGAEFSAWVPYRIPGEGPASDRAPR
ncbi:MAG: PAS domain-containing protein [Candidatus Eisenbacteria bacterium]|nr:PAS domain-containing protein [Candidatus Eisenbacteria bacterium]